MLIEPFTRSWSWLSIAFAFTLSLPSQAQINTGTHCHASDGSVKSGTTQCTASQSDSSSTSSLSVEGGIIKEYASATVNAANKSAGSGAHVTIDDMISIDSQGMQGQSGTLKIKADYTVDRTMQVGNSYASSADADSFLAIFASNSTDGASAARQYNAGKYIGLNGLQTSGVPIALLDGTQVLYTDPLELSLDFTFGVPIELRIVFTVSAHATQDGTSVVDGSHSFYWDGLTIAGLSPDQYTVSSSSGTDWGMSYVPGIPELPPFVMLGVGLALIATRKIIRNRHLEVEDRFARKIGAVDLSVMTQPWSSPFEDGSNR